MKWAAYSEIVVDGETTQQAIGPCCMPCYQRATTALGFETYSQFEKEWEAAPEDAGVRTLWKECIARENNPQVEPGWTLMDIDEETRYEVEVSKSFKGYTGDQIKDALGMIRLTNKSVAGLHQVTGPSILSPQQDESYYLFKCGAAEAESIDDNGVEIKLKCIRNIGSKSSHLEKKHNLHEQHARGTFGRAATKSDAFEGLHKLMRRKVEDVQTWSEFQFSHFEQKKEKMPPMRQAKSQVKIIGAAASELTQVVAENPEQAARTAMNEDLTDRQVAGQKLRRGKSSVQLDVQDDEDDRDPAGDVSSEEDDQYAAGAYIIIYHFVHSLRSYVCIHFAHFVQSE